MSLRKKAKASFPENLDLFDGLPDDLILSVLSNLASIAASPSDIISVRITCKRLNHLGQTPTVLSRAAPKAFDVNPQKWSESAHRFLKQGVAGGSVEASYTLGMIRFYCLGNRESGASLMAKAALRSSHALALYSLAVVHFNSSGRRGKDAKDLRAGVALCARAACFGNVAAIRELGHCLQDGFGVRRNIGIGRRLLVHANTRELAAANGVRGPPFTPLRFLLTWQPPPHPAGPGCPILSDYGCDVPAPEPHPANRFLVGWFGGSGSPGEGLVLCGNAGCGRPETRPNEFRRCSVCGKVSYCSRGCQAVDWKAQHKETCPPENHDGGGGGDGDEDDMVEIEIGEEDDDGEEDEEIAAER